MAKLIYSPIASLDGYVEDADGNFDWSAPDPEVHAFINENERSIGTYLYGRRMFETMRPWATISLTEEMAPTIREFAEIWRAADKIVYSTTLHDVACPRTTTSAAFEPAAICELKESLATDISVGGASLAARALRAGLVDELRLILVPVAVGAGKPALPPDLRLQLSLADLRRFDSGVVYLRYDVTPA